MKKYPAIFFGSTRFSRIVLNELLTFSYLDIKLVITNQNNTLALSSDIPVEFPNKIRNNEYIMEKIASLDCQVGILASYGKIIPQKLIDLFPKGIINVHPSYLPKYRGPSPIQSALLNEEGGTGITLLLMDNEIDHGPILCQKILKIEPTDTFTSLEHKLAIEAAQLFSEKFQDYMTGRIEPKQQDHTQATFTKKMETNDGELAFNQGSKRALAQIKALAHSPGTYLLQNELRIKILEIEPEILPHLEHKNLLFEQKGALYIGFLDGSLKVKLLQPEGKKIMTDGEFLSGYSNFLKK